ncbi:MAG TPA: hypothetical protein VK360_03075, partial [Acidimicrobiales bacterium]|nr:hypothetical protein [Acidimicrobiales bacterium]
MLIKRLGAVIVAVALVAGAFLVRNALDDDEPTVESGPGPGTTPGAATGGTIVCSTELGPVCGSIDAALPEWEVRVEPALATLDALADAGAEGRVWVTMAPFPGMVDTQRAAAGTELLGLESTPVGVSPLAVAAPNDGRLEALAADCAGAPLWRCIGDAAGSMWSDLGHEADGTVRPSVGDVERSGLALVALGGAVAGYFGDPAFTSAMWDVDPSFLPWLRKLATTVPADRLSGGTPLATMASRPSALDVAAHTDAERAQLSADPERFEVQYPEPAMYVEAVAAAPAGSPIDA